MNGDSRAGLHDGLLECVVAAGRNKRNQYDEGNLKQSHVPGMAGLPYPGQLDKYLTYFCFEQRCDVDIRSSPRHPSVGALTIWSFYDIASHLSCFTTGLTDLPSFTSFHNGTPRP
jgi:hypothetical protein